MKRIGKNTVGFEKEIVVSSFSSVGGIKENKGKLKGLFDIEVEDSYFGEKTWEKAESKLQSEAIKTLFSKANIKDSEVDFIFAGDLLNQCTASVFGVRKFSIPFLGQYGACSTMAQNIFLASTMIESGCASNCIAVASSHFCSAERQFRFPLEYGGQKTPTSQWTVTGAGATLVSSYKNDCKIKISKATVGKITDYGVKDCNNMGAAMAPAACNTIKSFLSDTGTCPNDYDLILTGDLGSTGSKLLYGLLENNGINIRNRHNDCGLIIFDTNDKNIKSGGSGCGCCASVLCAYILPKIQRKELNNVLFIATGALMSVISSQQGESIPSVAHLINFQSI